MTFFKKIYKIKYLLVILGCVVLGAGAYAGPEPSIIIYGHAYLNEMQLTAQDTDYTISIEVDGLEITHYTMGSDPLNGDYYVLYVPVDNGNPPVVDYPVGKEGEIAQVFINGLAVNKNPITLGSPASQTRLDINVESVSVNHVPTAQDDSAATDEDTAVSATLNADDVDGDALTYSVMSDPAHGSVTVNGDGSYTYTPVTDYYGSDSFSFKVNDGTIDSTPATINLTVTPVNDAPTISGIPATSVAQDSAYHFVPDASDVDGDTLVFSIENPPVWASFDPNTGELSGTPGNADVGTTEGIIIRVSDTQQTVSLAAFNLTVSDSNDAPTATSAGITTAEDTASTGVTPTVSDPDVGDSHSFTILTQPVHGTAGVVANQLVYTPDPNYNGQDSFTYLATDQGGLTVEGTATVNVTPINDAPVANGGSDQNVSTGTGCTLDGSDSYDPEGAVISFSWSLAEAPQDSLITEASISYATTAKPSFIPDVDGVYRFTLVVSDGITNSDVDEVTVWASTANVAPNAEAGADQNVFTWSVIYLDGSGSEDPDNGPEPLSYLWGFHTLPDGSSLIDENIGERNRSNARFTADTDGVYVLKLTVSDGDLASEDTVQITSSSSNVPPNAKAGEDISVSLGETVFLDGSLSNDSDNGPSSLRYQWRFVSLAEGSNQSNADIVNSDTANGFFTPDAPGTYIVQLSVNDGKDESSDNITILVEGGSQESGDLDGNNVIDAGDLAIFRMTLGACHGDEQYNSKCDYDGDGCITYGDYRIWYGYYKAAQ